MAESFNVRDLDTYFSFQRTEWRLVRVGWAALALIVVAACLGLFGIGPLSGTDAHGTDEQPTVHYERFGRHMGMDAMTIELPASAVQGGKATLSIDNSLLGSLRIEGISPQPDTETSTRKATTFEFSADPASPPVIEIVYRPDDIGLHRGDVRAGNAPALELWQFIYP